MEEELILHSFKMIIGGFLEVGKVIRIPKCLIVRLAGMKRMLQYSCLWFLQEPRLQEMI